MRYLLFIFILLSITNSYGQVGSRPTLDPWTHRDLMDPKDLASQLSNSKSKKPVIFNIGVVENIPGAKSVGGVSKSENLKLLKAELAGLKKDQAIVIYCGCCPFDRCPNVRPAFNALKAAGFTNFNLLNIPTNLKQDWIAKGYPLAR